MGTSWFQIEPFAPVMLDTTRMYWNGVGIVVATVAQLLFAAIGAPLSDVEANGSVML